MCGCCVPNDGGDCHSRMLLISICLRMRRRTVAQKDKKKKEKYWFVFPDEGSIQWKQMLTKPRNSSWQSRRWQYVDDGVTRGLWSRKCVISDRCWSHCACVHAGQETATASAQPCSAASAWMCRGHNLCRHSHDAIERLPLVCRGKDGRRLVDEEVDRPGGDNHVLTVD